MTAAQVKARITARISTLEGLITARKALPDGVVGKSTDQYDAQYEIDILKIVLGSG